MKCEICRDTKFIGNKTMPCPQCSNTLILNLKEKEALSAAHVKLADKDTFAKMFARA